MAVRALIGDVRVPDRVHADQREQPAQVIEEADEACHESMVPENQRERQQRGVGGDSDEGLYDNPGSETQTEPTDITAPHSTPQPETSSTAGPRHDPINRRLCAPASTILY